MPDPQGMSWDDLYNARDPPERNFGLSQNAILAVSRSGDEKAKTELGIPPDRRPHRDPAAAVLVQVRLRPTPVASQVENHDSASHPLHLAHAGG